MKKWFAAACAMVAMTTHAEIDLKIGAWLRDGVDSISAMENGRFTSTDETRVAIFMGYVIGAAEAAVITDPSCRFGNHINHKHITEAVRAYLARNQGANHLPAYLVVSNAIKPLMVCSK